MSVKWFIHTVLIWFIDKPIQMESQLSFWGIIRVARCTLYALYGIHCNRENGSKGLLERGFVFDEIILNYS